MMEPEEVEKFIRRSNYLELNQVSVQELRKRQDEQFNQKLIKNSLNHLRKEKKNQIDQNLFYFGSVDFMVEEKNNENIFRIIEANGGSSRGISSLPPISWRNCYRGLRETVKNLSNPLVVIGYLDDDSMVYEKVFLAEEISQKYGLKPETLSGYRGSSGVIILAPYSKITSEIKVKNGTPYLDGKKIDVMIGDGLARRVDDLNREGKRNNIDTRLANHVFPITDDKALTYKVIKEIESELSHYNIKPLSYWRAKDRDELEKIVREKINKMDLVIKPSKGSGGKGIEVVSDEENVKEKIDKSLEDYLSHFDYDRRGFPYTISEKVDSKKVNWLGAERNFDIRLYVAKSGNELIPCSGLARTALEGFKGNYKRESMVVNLSGYEGIDIKRGIGITNKNLNKLGITRSDFEDILSASVILFKSIVERCQLPLPDQKD